MSTLFQSTIYICIVAFAIMTPLIAHADVDIPAEWYGIWELELTSYDCDTEEILFTSTSLDTICVGDVFQDPDPSSFTVECTASIDANSYTISCEGESEIFPGCTAAFDYSGSATRNGDSYTSTTFTNITYAGDCGPIPDTCQRTEITGTRIASAPDPCDSTPVESTSWSAIKELYR